MRIVCLLTVMLGIAGCQRPATAPPPVVVDPGHFTMTVIGTVADGLEEPTGLGFAPAHPDQLWVVNRATNGVVIFFDPGTDQQHSETRVDRYAEHFMAKPSGMSFGDDNHFSTCQESRDEWNDHPQAPDDYMGPTLWTADLDVFAVVGQAYPKAPGALEGSHIDMLHESPLCMGIAHDHDNVFWAFDGLHGHIVRYDFVHDHGPGGSAHSDGIVRRYPEATVTRTEHTPSQLALDAASGSLYVADSGGNRVTRLDTTSGSVGIVTSPPKVEALAEYSQVTGVTYQVLVPSISSPSGLLLSGDRLYVASAASGEIVTYDLTGRELDRMATAAKGLAGLTAGPDGKLYFVDQIANTVTRVDP